MTRRDRRLGWLTSVATILACVIVALSAAHPVCAEDFGGRASDAVSTASADRVEAAGEHETCQCDRCGMCRWYQLRFAGIGNAAALASPPSAILHAAMADQGLAAGTSSEQPARAPPVPSHS